MVITGTHPYADMFPMLPEPELAELAESIRADGLLSPVVITPDGLILDGRNRAAACELAGVEPHFVIHDGEDVAGFVIASNITRRHMSTGARAMATARVLQADGRREDGRWKRGSIDIATSGNSESRWRSALAECGTILDFKPDLAGDVAAGNLELKVAYEQAKEIKEAEERDARIAAELAGTKYAALIENGTMTPAAAWAAHQEDTRKERDAQRQIEQGIRSANVQAAEAVHVIASLAPGDSFMRAFWPHHTAYVVEGMRITPQRCQDGITMLTRILKEFNQP